MARKELLQQKLATKMPLKLARDQELTMFAWGLFSDHLDKRSAYYDIRDPNKLANHGKYELFQYKLPLKSSRSPSNENKEPCEPQKGN